MAAAPRIDSKYCCFRLRLDSSPVHRWGVFACERIPARRKVIEYTGDLISRREARRRAGLNGHVYLFSVNPYWSKDGASGGSGAEYINHSCDPNVRACVIKGHILYFSRRVILPGEELLVDYNFARNAERHHCHCGASVCRGMINAK